jgi:beta-glucanase (GH16 family)
VSACADDALATGKLGAPVIHRIPDELTGYTLTWAEEFDGSAGALPSPGTWGPETGGHGWGNSELQYYTSEAANAALDGAGNLAMTVRRPDPQRARDRYGDCPYTSARLTTKGRKFFRYGLFQARIKLPAGRGIWPAFWMLGTTIDQVGWPACGEIDVMENFGINPNAVQGTVHGPGYSGASGITASLETSSPLADRFHLFSVLWEPGGIRWYCDEMLYHTVTPASLCGHRWVFDDDFYLLINVAVGGNPSTPPDSSTAFPQAMLIDYIRVYAPPV